jgi:hypothetical protein
MTSFKPSLPPGTSSAATSYVEAKRVRDEVEGESKTASAALRVFPRLANGLVPDAVKVSPEYRTAKARFDTAFARERAVNEWLNKNFEKEVRAERASRRRGAS